MAGHKRYVTQENPSSLSRAQEGNPTTLELHAAYNNFLPKLRPKFRARGILRGRALVYFIRRVQE